MFGMTADEIRLARKILAQVVFQPERALVGRRFQVDRIEDFRNSADLLPLMQFEGTLLTTPSNIQGTLLKYGFVDLRFSLGRCPRELKPARASVLSRLIGEDGIDRDAEPDGDVQIRIEHLESLCEEADAGVIELHVFASGAKPEMPTQERVRRTVGGLGLPAGFFPQEFEVTDAYLTNAPGVALFRHFYW